MLLRSSLGTLTITTLFQLASAFYSHPASIPRASVQRLRCSRIFSSASNAMGGDDSMKVLGVCGGIGSGKSTACKLLVDKLGCVDRIDADLLAHDVYEPGSQSLKDIVSEFGDDILSAEAIIDRKKLGAIVFSDNTAMARLEQIVWPHVRTKIEDRLNDIKLHHQQKKDVKTINVIIVEAALLLETDWHDLLDGLWIIQSSSSVAIQRLQDNRGLTKEEALARINAQKMRRGISNAEEPYKFQQDIDQGIVTAVINNDGTLGDLQTSLMEALSNKSSFKQQ